ncbi:hypothetical protein [Litorihabitans aurantiacus]|uniref:Uncharacterized protein n=1 Tax=Litorihabitans aurantiacus TaxID=1930061 RepID=A0AA37ULK2_9MICO|nr:hypothetical protein [Litorihabitans aurantiacus]GMA30244.1 hypothetical protein GCM10025875_02360 [Litorihabitans aurantiacus]
MSRTVTTGDGLFPTSVVAVDGDAVPAVDVFYLSPIFFLSPIVRSCLTPAHAVVVRQERR